MRRLFWHWAISAIALLLAASLLKPHVQIEHWYNAIWIAPVLGLVNMVVGWLTGILKIIAFPVNLLTLGCFGFVVSWLLYVGAIYWLGQKDSGLLYPAFAADGFLWVVALSVVMAMVGGLMNMVWPRRDRNR